MTNPLQERVLTVVGTYETHDKPTLGDGPSAKTNPHYEQPYKTLSILEVMAYQRTRVAKDKAQWVLCSTYHAPDGRKHKVQEAAGRFVMLAVDLDTGNVPGKELLAAVQSFTGPCITRIYSSSSATKTKRKWRVLVPLLQSEPFKTWLALQTALNEHIEKQTGHRPDRALERAGQPIYLPNTAPRSDDVATMIEDKLIDGTPFDWRATDAANDAVIDVMSRQEAHEQELKKRAIEAKRRMNQGRTSIGRGERSVIDSFNAANDLAQVLTACGWEEGPRNGWRSPNQTTGSYATKIFEEPAGQYWTSLSMSDFEASVGRHTADGRACFGDAFDVWCFKMHGNSREQAIKAAADELGIKPPATAAQQLADKIRVNQTKANQAPATKPASLLPDATKMVDDHTEDKLAMVPTATAIQQALNILLEQESQPQPKPLAAAFPELTDGAQILAFVQASHLPAWEPPRELIEGMLIEGAMSVVYGDSNTGKSFLVMDMAAHISLGETWFESNVQQGAVLYLASESPRSIMDRSRALAKRLNRDLDQFFITQSNIDMYNPNGDAQRIVDTVAMIEGQYGVKIKLIVVDTLARAMGAGDENSTKDMGQFVKHGDLIRSATNAHLMIIHHTGKDSTKGGRGSSALRAATDTEIEVGNPGDGKPREFKVTKQRDLDGKGNVYGFDLVPVALGEGVFGSVMTTCYVVPTIAAEPDPMSSLPPGCITVHDLISKSATGGLRWAELLKEITETTGKAASEGSLHKNLKELQKRGLVYQERTKQYRLGSGKILANDGADGARGHEF